jgi:hypothetical protein
MSASGSEFLCCECLCLGRNRRKWSPRPIGRLNSRPGTQLPTQVGFRGEALNRDVPRTIAKELLPSNGRTYNYDPGVRIVRHRGDDACAK